MPYSGDGDRNMILGRGFFITLSDSVAIIAADAQEAIPYFKSGPKVVFFLFFSFSFSSEISLSNIPASSFYYKMPFRVLPGLCQLVVLLIVLQQN